MQPWLLKKLIAEGKIEGSGISRTLKFRLCPGCKAPALVALDSDAAALVTWFDPSPLSDQGVLVTGIAGTRVFSMLHGKNGPYVSRLIKPGLNVISEHVCGRVLPESCYEPRPVVPDDLVDPPF